MNVRALLILVGSALLQGSVSGDVVTRWRDRVKLASDTRAFEPVSAAERAKAQALFKRSFHEGYSEDLAEAWASLAMDFSQETIGNETFLWLCEAFGAKRGRGCFVLRNSGTSRVALQCPHSFKDLATRKIGIAWMLEGQFDAAAFNTVPRSFTGSETVSVSADMAKEASTYFMAFTLAWARVHEKGAIVQLHGFSRDKRQSVSGKRSSVIVSSARKEPAAEVCALARELRGTVDGAVSVFPHDVRELGGTLNAQALGLRYLGYKRFIHLEVCQEERERLSKDRRYRKDWLGCLERGLAGGGP